MNEFKIGQFIAELRKEKQMTQKELADKLHITDKAVSKWERDLSCPDISLLSSLSSVLGVTTSELLSGKRDENTPKEVEEVVDNVIGYAQKTTKSKLISLQNIFALSFSLLLLVGIITCSIVDLAVSGSFSWSLYPISASVFTWLVFVPAIKFGKKGILPSLISFSVFIVPLFCILNAIIGDNSLFFEIGVKMSLVTVVFLWCVFVLFMVLKKRKFIAGAVSLLLGIPLCLIINVILSGIIDEPIIDVWDIMTFGILVAASITLFILDYIRRQRRKQS